MSSEKITHNATLVDGRIYVLLAQTARTHTEPLIFNFDQPVPVSEAVKQHLEEHAVRADVYTFGANRQERATVCKFKFEEISAPAN